MVPASEAPPGAPDGNLSKGARRRQSPVIGLGCMRLSTAATRDEDRAVAVVHAALDAGVTLLDTADAYALDERDVGHNERLIARALRTWPGDASRVQVATKGGLRRPGGRWVPDGRAKHLRAACEASARSLGVDSLDLYQLHAPDPRTPLETSVRALAALRDDGLVRRIGLCNVTVAQIEAARTVAPIDAVQVSLGAHDETNLRGGVAEYCRDAGILLLAYRPLGGERGAARLARDPVLRAIGERHDATPQEVALAWLTDLDPGVVPLPGATRLETARSLARVHTLALTDADRADLDARFPAGRLLRVPRARRRPPDTAPGDVVLVMGMPGAGKSTVAAALEAAGHARLNRDARGGRVADLVAALDAGLAAGRRAWVLDNTYPARAARNAVIECAWRHGVPVRCIHVATGIGDAQVNAVTRMVEAHGALPAPEDVQERGRADPRFFGPDAQFRWLRQVEPPVSDEGFAAIETRSFERRARAGASQRALFIEVDGGLCDGAALDAAAVTVSDHRIARVRRFARRGWLVFGLVWRPQLEAGTLTLAAVHAALDAVRVRYGGDVVDIAVCPHAAGPPVCWCRRPLPGHVVEAAVRHRVDPARSVMAGRGPADRTLAERLGMTFRELGDFFGAA